MGEMRNAYNILEKLKGRDRLGDKEGDVDINKDEAFYILGYNIIWSVKSQPTFRRNMLPPYPED
jgi:hypothetical protein